METILYLYEKCRALVNRGMPVSVLKEDNISNVSSPSNTMFQTKNWKCLMSIIKISTASTTKYWKETVKGGISLWQSNILA